MAAPLVLDDPAGPPPVAVLLRTLLAEAQRLERGEDPVPEGAARVRRAAEQALALVLHDEEPRPALSGREREVLDLLARGLSNPEVARVLGIAPATVRTYVEHLLRKLDVSNRVEAVALGLRMGLVRGP